MEDNPEGNLTKGKMIKMYSSVLTVEKAAIFVDQIFYKFDTDNNGNIDFRVTTWLFETMWSTWVALCQHIAHCAAKICHGK